MESLLTGNGVNKDANGFEALLSLLPVAQPKAIMPIKAKNTSFI
jgi:hypothetical protein